MKINKKIIIISVTAIAVVVLAVLAIPTISSYISDRELVVQEMQKASYTGETEPDYFGAYDDSSREKEMNRTIQFNGKQYRLKYDHTYNMVSELSVDNRGDSYGTYDIYIDENGTEFEFLYNSDLLCAMHIPLEYRHDNYYPFDKPVINKKEALDIANIFLEKNLDVFSEYQLLSYNYAELFYQYDIIYCKFLGEYQSDDIINIWVRWDGDIVFYSVRNLNRYADVKLSEKSIKTAEEKLIKQLDEKYGKDEYRIENIRISKDNEGFMILECFYVYTFNPDPNCDEAIIEGDIISLRIE